MGFITYKQADSRWGSKNYNGSSSMATAGCGPTSCAMIAYGVDGKTTPLDTMKYMQNHGYAIRNNGTAWAGIPACLKAYGVKDVQAVAKMETVWSLMSKGYVGVFLFRSGSRGGITWTTSGHYVAVTDYKVQNGKHYIYTRDSGGRNHTGWYCYETQMKGLIPQIWLGYVQPKEIVPVTKPTGKYSGSVPAPVLKNGSKGDEVKKLQNFLNWYGGFKLTADGIFGSGTEEALQRFQKTEGITTDGIYGKGSQAKLEAYVTTPEAKGYDGTFPTLPIKASTQRGKALSNKAKALAWALGTAESKYKYNGGAPTSACKSAMNKRGYTSKVSLSDCGYFQNSIIYATLGIKTKVLGGVKASFPSVDGFKVVHTGTIGSGVLKEGDIIRYKKKSGQHVLMYIGDGIIAEAGRKTRFGRRIKSTKYNADNVKHSTIQVLRAIEGTTDKSYISKGDTGTEVKYLQAFLNWFGAYGLSTDGDFGAKTETAVKDFQSKNGLTSDGQFGQASLAKAKEIKK